MQNLGPLELSHVVQTSHLHAGDLPAYVVDRLNQTVPVAGVTEGVQWSRPLTRAGRDMTAQTSTGRG